MANNPFQTPANPWPLVRSNGLLFNTPTRVSRLTTQWASPTGPFVGLKTSWSTTSATTNATAVTSMGYALKYLAAGGSSDLTNAYNLAQTETKPAGTACETDNPRLFSQGVPYVYAWCKGGLTGTQPSTLLTLIENNQAIMEANIGALGRFLIDGCGNGNVGMPGYVFGWCAADQAAGITDRTQNVTNLVQNMVLYINQQYNEGIWTSYDNLYDLDMAVIIAFHCATGNENLLASRCPSILGRGEVLARMLEGSGNNFYSMIGHNVRQDASGKFIAAWPGDAWSAAMYSDITKDLTMAWIRDQQLAHCTPVPWCHEQLPSYSTWMGFLFHDPGLTGVSPASANLVKCKAYPVGGLAEFRGGWNQSTDVVCDFAGGAPNSQSDHTVPNAGCLQIRVGPNWLVTDAYQYGHRASAWEQGVPVLSTEVGDYTMCRSGLSFSPAATQATREDRDGAASAASTAGSTAAFPLSYALTNNVRGTWLAGTMGALYDDGVLAKVTADISPAFPQCTSVTRTVGYRRGAGSDKGTFIVDDQYTAPGTIDHIRANFWSKFKPTGFSSETVLQGASAAGVVQWGGNKVVITNGGYQATIQCVSTLQKLHGIGGAGYESWFDGYDTGGANLDFVANSGGDSRNPTEFLWFNNSAAVPGQIVWRSSFLHTQATSGGEMLYVITVDVAGTTAPTYTYAQAKALLQPAGGGSTQSATAALTGAGALAGRAALRASARATLAGIAACTVNTRWVSPNPVALGSAGSASTNSLIVQTLFNAAIGDAIIVVAFSPDQTTLMTQAQDSNGTLFGVFAANIAAISPLPQALAAGSTIQLTFAGAPAAHTAIALLVPGTAIALDHLTPTVTGAAAMNLNLGVNT